MFVEEKGKIKRKKRGEEKKPRANIVIIAIKQHKKVVVEGGMNGFRRRANIIFDRRSISLSR